MPSRLLLCAIPSLLLLARCTPSHVDRAVDERALLRVKWGMLPATDTAYVYQEMLNAQTSTREGNDLKATYLDSLRPWALRRDSLKRAEAITRVSQAGVRDTSDRAGRTLPAAQYPAAGSGSTGSENILLKCMDCGCSDVDVAVFAENFIKGKLKSPSTADFGSFSDDLIKRNASRMVYTNHVDAQNGFGATIRMHFSVMLLCEGNTPCITDYSLSP